MPLYKYVAKRVGVCVGAIFAGIFVNFIVPRLVPGNPILGILSRLGAQGGTPSAAGYEFVREMERIFALDKPLYEQFFIYLMSVFKGNLGYSIELFPKSVNEIVAESLPWTIALLAMTTFLSWIIGNIIGVVAGWAGGKSKLSTVLSSMCLILNNIPYYIFALLLIYLFISFPLLPTSATPIQHFKDITLETLFEIIKYSILPALSIIVVSFGGWFFGMRALTISLKEEDFVRLAQAKGLTNRTIVINYVFRNALLPTITWLAISLGNIAGGAMLTEVIFSYPGTGYTLYNAIRRLDFPVIQGVTLVIIVGVSLGVLIVELLYPLVDPRIRRG